LEKAILRVLIVDDFQPWRQFLLSTLQKLPQLKVIGEEADGLSAVHSAEDLKPDLIILDISLPKLNGIEAARRIRKLSPGSRILFASADRSRETVEAALETGACGYLVKTDAGSELLPAIAAVIGGKPFVSAGVGGKHPAQAAKRQNRDGVDRDSARSAQNAKVRHEVDFYHDDIALVNGFCRSIEDALKMGAAVIVIATASHHAQILEQFTYQGTNINAAMERGGYLSVNAVEALEMMMSDGMPDEGRCSRAVGDLIARARKAVTLKGARVAICGECAPTLLQEGKTDAAIRLEQIWDEVTKQHNADTLCGYLWSAFPEGENSAVLRRIRAEHSAVRKRSCDREMS